MEILFYLLHHFFINSPWKPNDFFPEVFYYLDDIFMTVPSSLLLEPELGGWRTSLNELLC